MAEKTKLEKDIQREILEYLHKRNLFFWRANNIPVYGKNNGGKYQFRALPKFTPKGIPDIFMIKNGRFIGIEVKRVGAKLSPEQAKFGLDIVKNGGAYIVVHSVEETQRKLFDIDTLKFRCYDCKQLKVIKK